MSKLRIALVIFLTFGAVGGARRQAAAENPPPEVQDGAARRVKLIEMKHEDRVNGVAFSPDGKVLASCSGGRNFKDHAIRLWDSVTGKQLRRLDIPCSGVCVLGFAPDGKALAEGVRGDGGFSLWNPKTGKDICHLYMAGRTDRPSLAFSPDGNMLATGKDREVILWELPAGKERFRLKDLGREVQVALAAGGRTLVTADDSGKLRFWDTTSGELSFARELPRDVIGDDRKVYAVASSPDGKIIVTGHCCATRLWDAATGRLLRRLPGHLGEHGWYPNGSFAFAPDGKTFFSGGFDGAVRRWDVATGRELTRYKGCAGWYQPVAVSPDGKKVAAGGQDYFVRMWDVETGRQLAGPIKPPRRKSKPPILHQHDGEVTSLAFSPDGKKLASTGKDGQLVVSMVATRELLFETEEHWGGEYAVVWSGDGKRLASTDQDGVIRLWDAAAGKQLGTLKGHKGIVAALAFSSHNKLLASGGYDGFLHLWNWSARKSVRRWKCGDGRVTALAFTPDGKTLVTGGVVCTDVGGGNSIPMTHGDKVRFWDVDTGKALTAPTLQGDTIAFSGDGRILIAGGLVPDITREGNGVGINGKEIIVVSRRGVEVLRIVNRGSAAALAPNNVFLATAGSNLLHLRGLNGGNLIGVNGPDVDSSFRLWELASGKEVLRLPKLKETGIFTFAPDSRTLAYATPEGAVAVLDLAGTVTPNDKKDLKILLNQLADKDAAIAYRAGCSLIAGGPEVVGLLRERLRPIPATEAEHVKKLLARLDDERFEEREAASRGLLRFGAAIEPAVREGLNGRPSLEVRRRLEAIWKEMAEKRLAAEELRGVRALRVLEQIGTPEARRVLEVLSHGAIGFVRTEEARAALARLDKRGVTPRSD